MVFHVYSPDDLSKKWFISYYVAGKRVRVYGDINKASTVDERTRIANELLCKLKGQEEELQYVRNIKQECIEYLNSCRLRKNSKDSYMSMLTVYFKFNPEDEVTQERVERFFSDLRATRNPTTHNNYLVALKRMMDGVGVSLAWEKVPRLKEQKQPCKYFQRNQINRLRPALEAEQEDLFFFVQFIYYCFIRPTELRRLQVEHILFETQQIRIPGEISKNKKTEFISIPDCFFPVVVEKLKGYSPNHNIFPVGRNTMYQRHKKVLKELGFGKGYSLYSWKHTGAVQAVRNGISLKELQIQLRHHSLDQVDQYLRQMGVHDLAGITREFPVL